MGNSFGKIQPSDIIYPSVNKFRIGSYIKGFNVYKRRRQLSFNPVNKSEEKNKIIEKNLLFIK